MTIKGYIKHLKYMIEEFKRDKKDYPSHSHMAGWFDGKINAYETVIKQLENSFNGK